MAQRVLPVEMPQELIALPLGQVLDEFGRGSHIPGSGSAAALMGLLAAQLTLTVCKITALEAAASPSQLRYLADRLTDHFIPELERLFQKDADDFDTVVKLRRERNDAEDGAAKRRLREAALRGTERATELVLDIGDLCLELVDHAAVVFDSGAKKVRGDSGAAISAAIAGAMSAIFVANVNLRSFQGGRWAVAIQARVNRMNEALLERQAEALSRASALQPSLGYEEQGLLFGDLD
jgi:formiminotetrahydrofolate cyclodeaminase